MNKMKIYHNKKVLANGCFDILHAGHIELFKKCSKLAGKHNEVIVALNTDKSIKRLKGKDRPINSYKIRSQKILETGFITRIIPFDTDDELREIIRKEKINYLVKGSDYRDSEVVGSKEVFQNDGEVHFFNLIEGYSTTNINFLKKLNILITGGLGFIGSNLIEYFNKQGIEKIFIVDDLKNANNKWKNINGLNFIDLYDYKDFLEMIDKYSLPPFDFVINLGACSSTSEENFEYLWNKNTVFARKLFGHLATNPNIKIIHASSAATYGLSDDFSERVTNINPLNKYGFSKLVTDKMLNQSINTAEFKNLVYSLRFFNVYGPRETYKDEMKSIVTKFIEQDIEFTKTFPNSFFGRTEFEDKKPFECFKSYKKGFDHGEMKRDFIYVEDVCKIIFHFIITSFKTPSGIYNVGTGKATSVNEVMKLINANRRISYVEMPENLKSIYQYFTEANIDKLKNIGYTFGFTPLEIGIEKTKNYIKNTL